MLQGEAQYGTTVLLPHDAVWSVVSEADAISKWAPSVVECCIIENGVDPEYVGCARRCLLRDTNHVLRETVTARNHTQCKSYISFKLTNADKELRSRALPRDEASLTFFPCPVEEMLTTLLIAPISTDSNKCFVEAYSSFGLGQADGANATAAAVSHVQIANSHARVADDHIKEIEERLTGQWLGPLVRALAEHCLQVAFPVASGFDSRYRRQYEYFESFLVEQLGKGEDQSATAQHYEELLASWTALAKDTSVLEGHIGVLKEELAAARLIASAASRLNLPRAPSHAPAYQPTIRRRTPSPQPNGSTSGRQSPMAEGVRQAQENPAPPPPLAAFQLLPPAPVVPLAASIATSSEPFAVPPCCFRRDPETFNTDVVKRALRSGLVPSEADYGVLFSTLDYTHRGYLTFDEVRALWNVVDPPLVEIRTTLRDLNSGAATSAPALDMQSYADRRVERWMNRHSTGYRDGDGQLVMQLQDFTVFYLQLLRK